MSILENLRNLNNILAAIFFLTNYVMVTLPPKDLFYATISFYFLANTYTNINIFILSRYHPITSKMLHLCFKTCLNI